MEQDGLCPTSITSHCPGIWLPFLGEVLTPATGTGGGWAGQCWPELPPALPRAWGWKPGMSRDVGTGAALVSVPGSKASKRDETRWCPGWLHVHWGPLQRRGGIRLHVPWQEGRRAWTWPLNETNLYPNGQSQRRIHVSTVSPCKRHATQPARRMALQMQRTSLHITAWYCGVTTINIH